MQTVGTVGARRQASGWSFGVGDDDPVSRAMWRGDVDALDRMAACRCCCDEHTFPDCPARAWGGCRGSLPPGFEEDEEESWVRTYAARGFSRDKFYGWSAGWQGAGGGA